MDSILLTREAFKEKVFSRDKSICVVCEQPAKDAHHLIDRSLWENGGYYVDNGVSLCESHHWDAEKTLISCKELREKAGITNIILPDHFYADEQYDHWGNIMLPNGMRIKGELFGSKEVQKLLEDAGVMGQFLEYIKYPRTYHFPFSPNLQNDDRKYENVDFFNGKKVVTTLKMDGENCSMYRNYIHARSLDSRHHPSRDWVKAFHGSICYDIPDNWRICGESMYAEHSIHYNNLESYFLAFSIWDDTNTCLNWEETVTWCRLLGIAMVPVLCEFEWQDAETARALIEEKLQEYAKTNDDPIEGYVVRLADDISYKDYRRSYAKCVRQGHVQTDEFWMTKPVVANGLRSK